MLYEFILINEIEQSAKIIFLSVAHAQSHTEMQDLNKHNCIIVTVLHTGIQERGDEDCDKRGI